MAQSGRLFHGVDRVQLHLRGCIFNGNLANMGEPAASDLAELVSGARSGDGQALARLFEILYDDLRRVARARLRGGAPITLLNTTGLVHESYERLAGLDRLDVSTRAHFMAYASRAMRSVIVDAARQRNAERRGGGAAHVTLTTDMGESLSDNQPDVLRVHEAVDELAHIEPRLAQVVEMRHFGGLEYDEIAEALGVSKRTVERDWERARSFLYASLSGDG